MLLLAYGWHSASSSMVGIVLSSAYYACNAMPSKCCLGHDLQGSRGSVTYATAYRPGLTSLTKLLLTTAFFYKPRGIWCKLYFLCIIVSFVHAGMEGMLLLCVSRKQFEQVCTHGAKPWHLPGVPNLLAKFTWIACLVLISNSSKLPHISCTTCYHRHLPQH